MIKTFIISLQRSQDRREIFNKYNSKYIKDYEFFDAIDGQTLDINDLSNKVFTKLSKNYTKGALGCALSHLALWEKCIELNEPILIMEDDVILSQNFKSHFNNVYNSMLPTDWDIVQLSYNCDSVVSFQNTSFENCHCIFGKKKTNDEDIKGFVKSKIIPSISRLNHSFGMSAYIIHPKGAKIIKEKCFPLDNRIITLPFLNSIRCFTIDCMMNSFYKDINAFICVNPFVITPHLNEEYKTTIM